MRNIPKGYKLVPVETLKFALGLTRHGFKNRTDQEADKYAALKTITELLESPTQQPIYDEAKERELFEAWYGNVRLLSMDGKNRFMHDQDGTYWFIGTRKAWSGWIACATRQICGGGR